MNEGSTLIESLIVCLFIPTIISLIIALLNIMTNFNLNTVNQNEIFEVQFNQLMSRVMIKDCNNDFLQYSFNNKLYTITFDNNRIIKKPGYEILLFNVDELFFEKTESQCILNYHFRNESFKLEYKY